MPRSARLFLCARCRAQVVLCRRCDRGQLYCDSVCSRLSRAERSRQARQRHARSRAGRHNNAIRQRRFRQRQRDACKHKTEIVTDQGSAPIAPVSTLAPEPVSTGVEMASVVALQRGAHLYCHHCAAVCSALLRRNFLRPAQRRVRDPPA